MKTTPGALFMYNKSIYVWQWDDLVSGKNKGNYFVVAGNHELAKMQQVIPGNCHVECIVDNFGNLVRAAA